MPTPCATQGVRRIAVARHEPGRERGRPEAVARAREPDADVCCVLARVEAADEQPHPGIDDSRAASGLGAP